MHMPELPEITNLAAQMKAHLVGRTFSRIEVIQPKALNMPEEEFHRALTGAKIIEVNHRGKWLLVETTQGWLLLHLGMGGEILLTNRDSLPEKRRIIFDFEDGSCLCINFWWFGYAHFAPPGALDQHEMVRKLGPNALELNADDLQSMMRGRRGTLKTFLLDQSRIAGIGNAYIHDILFFARLHPLRRIDSLTEAEFEGLAKGIQAGLSPAIEKGGSFYEMDLFGKKGEFLMEDIQIGYKEGQPCPDCGTSIEKIKTGSTSGFICPACQPLESV
jgi:formamidopyrimidine-DNA glycosylase